jgi:predicted AAA+ superfamily ATPase
MPGWWDNLWARAEQAEKGTPVLVLLDEIQHLPEWSHSMKTKIDELARRERPVHIVATGSSALTLGRGTRETMAGRFERLQLVHWQAAEIASRFGLAPAAAADVVVRFGGYPGALGLRDEPSRWRAYVLDAIVEPAIGRDLLTIERIRKPALLRQVYAVAVGHPAQIVSLQKIRGQIQDRGALETIAHYLALLEEAFLIAALPKHAGTVVRQRAAPPKLVALNNALLATALGAESPTPQSDPERWGRWVENACIAMAWNSGQTVRYWRREPIEVDFVSSGSWGAWAVEVKTGTYGPNALRGILTFCRDHPEFRPVIVCDPGREAVAVESGVRALSWPDYLHRGLA